MAIPVKGIGTQSSTKEQLLWQISKQLETLTKVMGNVTFPTCPECPTTTTTTTSALFSGTITWNYGGDPCTDIGGTVTGVTGNGTTFCNSTEIYSEGFVGLPYDTYLSANNGQKRFTQFNGTNTAVFVDACTTCP